MIIVAGDSFVYGSELKDATKTFPKILAQQYEDISWPGYANDSIARTTIERCEQGGVTGVIVSWTFPGRYEFRFAYNTKQIKSPWYSINAWTIKENIKEIEEEFITKNQNILNAQIDTINRARQTGVAEFADAFYKHVGSTEYWEIYSSLKEIVYLQNYLKIKLIPFMFTCADTILFYHATKPDSVLDSLFYQIDFDHWFLFPPATEPQNTTTPRGFYQWAIENKYPVGTTHPLESAHQAAANLIQEKFNELVTKFI
jgi:hypothetical protein